MTEPFDRTLASPIVPVLQLAASGRDSVVVLDANDPQLTAVQERMRIGTGLAEAIVAELDREPAAAVIASGSAGAGKSLLLQELASAHRERFEVIVEDATHAEAPDRRQADTLIEFFAPL